MLRQKIIEKLNSTFLNNIIKFPKEIVNIVASYTFFSSYDSRDLEKIEEARFVACFDSRSTQTYGINGVNGKYVGKFEAWKNETKLPNPIFHSTFSASESREFGSEEIKRYQTACKRILDVDIFDNFLSGASGTSRTGSFKVKLLQKTEIGNLLTDLSTDLSSNLEAWEMFKTFDVSSTTSSKKEKEEKEESRSFTWNNLHSLIKSSIVPKKDGSKVGKIIAIDFDYKKSQFILIVKLDKAPYWRFEDY
jgi:hypothetical protein